MTTRHKSFQAISISMVIWAAPGGRASLLGACIGAIAINMIVATASESEMLQEGWRLLIGLVVVLAVLSMPRGLAGRAQDIVSPLSFGGRRAQTRVAPAFGRPAE